MNMRNTIVLFGVFTLFFCSATKANELRIIVGCNDPQEEKTIRQYAETKVTSMNNVSIVDSGHGDVTIHFKCVPQNGSDAKVNNYMLSTVATGVKNQVTNVLVYHEVHSIRPKKLEQTIHALVSVILSI